MIVQSVCPISGKPIFMRLRTMAQAEAHREARMREDAERLRVSQGGGVLGALRVSAEFLKSKTRG
jgi:hypothetical protein